MEVMAHGRRAPAPSTLFAVLALVFSLTTLDAGDVPVMAGPLLSECEYDPATKRVSIDTEEPTELRRNGRDIHYRSQQQSEFTSCDGATVDNTDVIEFTDTSQAGEAPLYVDLSWGRFVPGATPENQGQSEIEFQLTRESLEPSRFPYLLLYLEGTDRADYFVGGARGMKLNRDKDLDISFRSGEGSLEIDTEAGDDEVFLDGRSGTGPFDPTSNFAHDIETDRGEDHVVGSALKDDIDGGAWRDRLKGGGGIDRISGEGGSDRMVGQKGNDYLHGLDGRDRAAAGPGNDVVIGHDGDDRLEGGSGDDRIRGNRGNDHLDGDAGIDVCDPGLGKDTKKDCER